MKNSRGSAYVYVVIVMLTVFLMLYTAVTITGYEMKVSKVFVKSADIYSYALNMAEEACLQINASMEMQRQAAHAQAVENIFSEDIEKIIFYEAASPLEPYKGDFFFKEKNSSVTGAKNVLYERIFIRNLYTAMPVVFNFSKQIQDENAGGIQLSAQAIKSGEKYVIEITATTTSSQTTYKGQIAISEKPHKEVAEIGYEWRTVSPLFSARELTKVDWAGVREQPFDEDNPLVMLTDDSAIDISSFYVDGNPIPSVVICGGNLSLTASDGLKTKFTGVIVSNGEVVNDSGGIITLNGALISSNAVPILNTTVVFDENVIFSVNFKDKYIKRQLFDILGLTAFNRIGTLTVTDEVKIRDIFNYLKPSANKTALTLLGLPQIKYELLNFKQVHK